MDEILTSFGHPFRTYRSADKGPVALAEEADKGPVALAEEALRPWLDAVQEIMRAPGTADLARAGLGSTDSVHLELGTWLSTVSADPASAALLGHFAKLPIDADRGYRMLSVIGAFAVPAGNAASARDVPAHALARQWRAETKVDQEGVKDLMLAQHDGLQDVLEHLPQEDDLICIWAPCIVVPKPDPPDRPELSALPASAHTAPNSRSSWRGGFLARNHQASPVAITRAPDNTAAPSPRRNDVTLLPMSGQFIDQPWETDQTITYQVWAQDPWGQWSGGSERLYLAPPTPGLPASPHVSLEVQPAIANDTDSPRSPGTILVTAFAQDVAPGSETVASMEVSLLEARGLLELTPDSARRWWTGIATVRPTRPGEKVNVTVTVTSITRQGTRIPDQPRDVDVVDPRPVAVPATSTALIFTGPPAPDGTCELDVVIPGAAAAPTGTGYRVYCADEAALPGNAPQAAARHERVTPLRNLTDRSRYALIAEAALEPNNLGQRLRVVLPGRSNALRVFQVVPVSAGGIESPSALCPPFVVATPLHHRPPRPSLEARPANNPREIEVIVSVTHPRGPAELTALTLRGLDHTAALTGEVLWAIASANSDHAVPATTVRLDADHPGEAAEVWRWTGTARLRLPKGVLPYAPLRLWSRAAWPPEPAHTPDLPPEHATVTRTWGDLKEQPGEWSELSLPCHVTPAEPAHPVTARVEANHPNPPQLEVNAERVDFGSPGYRIVLSHPDHAPIEYTAYSNQTVDTPTNYDATDHHWRITVIRPDGTLGGVFRTTGEAVDPEPP